MIRVSSIGYSRIGFNSVLSLASVVYFFGGLVAGWVVIES